MRKKPALIIAIIVAVALAVISRSPSDKALRSKVVRLTGHGSSCSGQQVRGMSGADYILTAAHCKMLADKDGVMTVITESGHALQRRVIAEDPKSDLLLIEGLPMVSGLDIAASVEPGDEVRTFTHGAAKDTYKTVGEIIQKELVQVPLPPEVLGDTECGSVPKYVVLSDPFLGMPMCVLSVMETAATAMTVPGSSGGAVVNSSGELVGVVSAGDGKFSYLVTLTDIRRFMSSY